MLLSLEGWADQVPGFSFLVPRPPAYSLFSPECPLIGTLLPMPDQSVLPEVCQIALKEWAATCRALATGRQIILLRKGGLQDAGGTFALEAPVFWLMPTGFHQTARLLKAEHRDLLDGIVEPAQVELSLLAEVVQTWSLGQEHEARLQQAPHVWSQDYLDQRYAYQPDRLVQAAAVRVWQRAGVHTLPLVPEYGGCRSWVNLQQSLTCDQLQPVMGEASFATALRELNQLFSS